ncbi:hypothetical protein ACFLIM_31880 [Nonomuraea sp. M3C6]|uniref:Uncharacterized protein n=1 Tax=Nonomuraea marmarensis TaxID=3351344 RepID=A0ABW7AN17_9ACTN
MTITSSSAAGRLITSAAQRGRLDHRHRPSRPRLDEAHRIVMLLLEVVPSGSHLALTHATFDLGGAAAARANAQATPFGEPAEVSGYCGVGRKP